MRNILLIARREYLEQIRGRAFRLTTVLLPLLFGGMMGVGYFTSHRSVEGRHVAIAADSAALAGDVRSHLLEDKDAKLAVDVVAPATAEDRTALLQQVQSKSIDGFLWIGRSAAGAPVATYISRSLDDSITTRRLKSALNRSLVNERLTAKGMPPAEAEALLKDVSVEALQVNKEGKAAKSNGAAALYKGMIMAFLLTMTTLLYGLDMARSIIEEKSSRIFEVMLSVVKSDDLLAGKLIGVGAVGLTQIAIWVAAAAVLAGSALAAPLLTGDFALHFSWLEGVLFPLFFVLGFFLYSSVFSGLAATCETAQELQMYMPLAAAPVWLSFGIAPLLVSDPNSVWALAASFFPATAPFVMMLRMGLQTPPAWQFAVSIGLMVLSVVTVLWFSSRLYRVGILMYGKRATLPEILRWLRYS
jgi:ABC-2 type transport system permease protein